MEALPHLLKGYLIGSWLAFLHILSGSCTCLSISRQSASAYIGLPGGYLASTPICCYLAAVLPAIYPAEYIIIAGINSSYTLIGTLTALLSLIAGFKFLIRERCSWLFFVLAAGLYVISTKLMEQAVFLSGALGLIYVMSTPNWKRKALLSLVPIAFSVTMELHRMVIKAQRVKWPPLIISPGTTFFGEPKSFYYTSLQQMEYLGIWLFAVPFLLSFLGYSYAFRSDNVSPALPHFAWLPRKIGFVILPAFVLFWTIPSVFPFIAMTKYFLSEPSRGGIRPVASDRNWPLFRDFKVDFVHLSARTEVYYARARCPHNRGAGTAAYRLRKEAICVWKLLLGTPL